MQLDIEPGTGLEGGERLYRRNTLWVQLDIEHFQWGNVTQVRTKSQYSVSAIRYREQAAGTAKSWEDPSRNTLWVQLDIESREYHWYFPGPGYENVAILCECN